MHLQSTKVVLVLVSSSHFLLELMQAVYKVQFLLDEFTYTYLHVGIVWVKWIPSVNLST